MPFLHKYVDQPIEVFLPHPPQRLRTKLPTVWSEEQIEQLINSIDITTPIGKRDYAIILLGARLGLRIGDILSLTFNDIDWGEETYYCYPEQDQGTGYRFRFRTDAGWGDH